MFPLPLSVYAYLKYDFWSKHINGTQYTHDGVNISSYYDGGGFLFGSIIFTCPPGFLTLHVQVAII